MTDGPFKSPKLGRCWKRLVEAVHNDAASSEECAVVASDAVTRHLVIKEHVEVLREISAHLGQSQLEFDPLRSIEAIFHYHEKTPFLDNLEKEILCRASDYQLLSDAVASALDVVIDMQIGEARNRFHEECIHAQAENDLRQDAVDQSRRRVDAAFDAVNSGKVRGALLEGRKDAFKTELKSPDGVDEGMVRL